MSKKSDSVIKCRKTNYDMIQFKVDKGEREPMKTYAESKGLNLSEFVRLAVRHAMETGFPPTPPSSKN